MSNGSTLSLAELEDRIAIARDNIRQLIEQAAGASGAQNEERNADRIAEQNDELERLIKLRDELLKKRKKPPCGIEQMGSKACVDAITAKESSKAQIGKPGRNNMDKFAIAAAIGLAMALAPARAAELKVIAGGSMTASLKEIGPQFEKATGHKLDITFAATPELIKMATSGPFDFGVVPMDVMKNEGARGKFAGTPGVIARVVNG